MEAPMEIRRLEVEKRNQKTAAGVAAFLFLGVLVACFFITAFTISNPPPGQQFVAVGFADLGDVEQASGDVDSEAPSEIVEDAVEEAVAESIPEEAAVAERWLPKQSQTYRSQQQMQPLRILKKLRFLNRPFPPVYQAV